MLATMPESFADEFSPRQLLIIQKGWINQPLAKATVNMYTSYVVRMFEWAARFELVNATVWHALQSVGRIKERHAIKPTRVVRTVAWHQVEAIKPFISPVLWDVIQVQWHTGMRAEEVLKMRPDMINQEIWAYVMTDHKTKSFIDEKVVFLGPQTRKIIEPYLTGRAGDMPLFSPIEAQLERRKIMRANRKSKPTPSQMARAKLNPKRKPGFQYQTTSYFRAIHTACERAGIVPWSSHQLRHSKATIVRKRFGLEGTQLTLGHKSIKTSEIYAQPDFELARQIAEELG
jgi:integrase